MDGDHSDTNLPDIAKSTLIVADVVVRAPIEDKTKSITVCATESEHDVTDSLSEMTPDFNEHKRVYSDSDSASKTISSHDSSTRLYNEHKV